MAPISSIFRREDDLTSNGNTAYHLLITFIMLSFIGSIAIITLAIFRKIRRNRQSKDLKSNTSLNEAHLGNHNTTSVSRTNEKSTFLDDEPYSPTDPVPQIRITFPEEPSSDGKRQSRIVIVKIGEQGSVGYEPYQEPLPVYQEKDSASFQSVDLERIGGLKENESKS